MSVWVIFHVPISVVKEMNIRLLSYFIIYINEIVGLTV